MSLGQRTFILYLALTPGCGGKTVSRILARNELIGRTPDEFIKLPSEVLREEYRLPIKLAERLAKPSKKVLEGHQETQDRLDQFGVRVVTSLDAGYPQLVEQMDPNPPGILFLYGNARLLESKTFCVLSSRNARPAQVAHIETLSEEGVLNAEVLVTGHDTPEYQRAAVVPLRYGSPRILCLDKGLFQVLGQNLNQEAFRMARLYRYEFDPKTDLAVSPFRPESDFIGANNRVRDRLVACLANRLDFAYASESGNMDKLIKLALKTERRVRVSDASPNYRQYRELGAEILNA